MNIAMRGILGICLAALLAAMPAEGAPEEVVVLGVMRGESIYAPCVLVENGIWRMWFGGWMSREDIRGGDDIYYSESTDGGLAWSVPRVMLHAPHESNNDPTVVAIRDGQTSRTRYLMYYTCRLHEESEKGIPNPQVALAVSDDGLTWERRGVVIGKSNGYDDNQAWAPSAVAADAAGETIHVFYHTRRSEGRILRSTMADGGARLVKTEAAVPAGGALKTCVHVSRAPGGKWWMFYNEPFQNSAGAANSRIAALCSDDGLRWEANPGNPVLEIDERYIGSPFVVWKSAEEYALFFGAGGFKFPRRLEIVRMEGGADKSLRVKRVAVSPRENEQAGQDQRVD